MPHVCLTGRRSILAVAAFLLWPILAAVPFVSPDGGAVGAQERPLTPTLLRRLAEAVDGHRTGNPVWVVVEYRFPNRVLAVHDDRLAATADSVRLVSGRADALGVLGPFVAPPDTLRGTSGVEVPRDFLIVNDWHFVGGCKHDRITSVMEARLGLAVASTSRQAMCPRERILQESIQSMTLTYVLASGDTLNKPVPLWADAVFFTLTALDKFAFPYYARVLGMPEAELMRRQVLRDMVP